MRASKAVPVYRWLAEHYDEIFPPDFVPLQRAREEVLGSIHEGIRSACDLAAGTGNTAVELARMGIRVCAVDLSPGMCRITRAKARKGGLPIRVIQADMRTFRLPEQVDLVLCEGDALNHIPFRSDLLRVAKAVHRALKPGGSFYFDVNNAAGFKRYWTGNVWMEKPGIVMVMRNGHRKDGSRAWSDIEWFLQEGRSWRRHRERVEEVSWTAEEIRCALSSAGFGRVRVWDAAQFFDAGSPVTPGCRTLYLAQKPR